VIAEADGEVSAAVPGVSCSGPVRPAVEASAWPVHFTLPSGQKASGQV